MNMARRAHSFYLYGTDWGADVSPPYERHTGRAIERPACLAAIVVIVALWVVLPRAQTFDLVIVNGRVIDPESNLDALRSVGISGQKIAAVSVDRLTGRATIDATGLVVVPGFVDLHAHGQTADVYRLRATDGVTTALELEVGAGDIDDGTGSAKADRPSTME